MKRILFAIIMPLLVASYPTHAVTKTPQSNISIAGEEATDKINLNTADVQALTQSFKGIGKKRAEAIIAYRETHGAFKSVEDLASVRGIGKPFVTRNLTALQKVFSVS